MIGGIVLAAGLSERMGEGRFKQLLPVGGRPMVAVVAARAADSDLDRVVVVTGHRGDEVAAAVRDLGVSAVSNPDYRLGNMTSFRTGREALPGCEAFVVLLADMPGVTSEMINEVVAYWHAHQPWAAVCSFRGRRVHPLLLSASAMDEAVRATGPRAVWRLLNEAAAVEDIEFDLPAPADVNTPDDYRELAE